MQNKEKNNLPDERHIRFFRNGHNQALRIPREFEMDADEAIIRREKGCLVIKPIQKKELLKLLETLPELDENLPDVDENLTALDDVES